MSSIAAQFATRGKKCVAIGRNYAAHIKELNNATPTEPFFFLKPTSSYALSEDGKVEIPQGVTVHHEVELGVVIGKTARDIPAAKAYEYVAGYVRSTPLSAPRDPSHPRHLPPQTLAIDYTGRNMQDAVKAKGLPWSAAKGFDTFCPVGEFIPKEKIPDPHNLKLWYKINGETKQSDSTNLMLYRIPQLIEHVSGIMTLEEGDLLLTGTPQGVGPIAAGDKITAGLETAEGESLSVLQHVVKAREGGYKFGGKL
ncbi:hypothetical protein JCM11251_005166 [Rhodosporidiobolus azoricus]